MSGHRRRKAEEGPATAWITYTSPETPPRALQARHMPNGSPADPCRMPYAVIREASTGKVLSRPLMGAFEWESFRERISAHPPG